jgi:hypothetical protein
MYIHICTFDLVIAMLRHVGGYNAVMTQVLKLIHNKLLRCYRFCAVSHTDSANLMHIIMRYGIGLDKSTGHFPMRCE